jgi:hypothetical protein
VINVQLDTSAMAAWAAELSARGLKNAIRRALDQSGRFARKATIPKITQDIGTTPAKIRPATPRVVGTKAGDLAARWTVSKMKIGARNVQGMKISKGDGLRMSTHRLTPGGSTSLHVKRAFQMSANGGTAIVYRTGKLRYPLRPIHGEHPATSLGQQGGTVQEFWKTTAGREVEKRLDVEIARQLRNEKIGPWSPDLDGI